MLCHPRSYTTEAASNVCRRPHMDGTSDMYWISAANLAMHHNLLSELAVGVLGSVFSALGDVSDNCVSHFMLFQVTFSTVGINTLDIHEKHDLNREIRKTRGFMKTQGFRPSPTMSAMPHENSYNQDTQQPLLTWLPLDLSPHLAINGLLPSPM